MNRDGICHFLCNIAVRDGGGAHQTQPPVEGGCPWCRGRGAAASSDEPDHPCRSSFSSTRDDIPACDRQGPFSDMGRMTSSHIIPLWRLKRHEPIVWPCRGAISDVTGPDGEPHEMMARERLGNVAQREEAAGAAQWGAVTKLGDFVVYIDAVSRLPWAVPILIITHTPQRFNSNITTKTNTTHLHNQPNQPKPPTTNPPKPFKMGAVVSCVRPSPSTQTTRTPN